MTGKIDVGSSGLTKLALNKDGIDFAAVSLQPIPAGEYVPLLFTARNLTAEASAGGGELRGMYDVPSYRGATFMDPKVGDAQPLPCNPRFCCGTCIVECHDTQT
jgi:photosystem II oxygen-evolving enhancer protein 1